MTVHRHLRGNNPCGTDFEDLKGLSFMLGGSDLRGQKIFRLVARGATLVRTCDIELECFETHEHAYLVAQGTQQNHHRNYAGSYRREHDP